MRGDELHRKLIDLHRSAGEPSTRWLAGRVGVTHGTISQLLRGVRLGKMDNYRALVEAMGGDWREFEPLWPMDRQPVHLTRHEYDALMAEVRAIRALLENQ